MMQLTKNQDPRVILERLSEPAVEVLKGMKKMVRDQNLSNEATFKVTTSNDSIEQLISAKVVESTTTGWKTWVTRPENVRLTALGQEVMKHVYIGRGPTTMGEAFATMRMCGGLTTSAEELQFSRERRAAEKQTSNS